MGSYPNYYALLGVSPDAGLPAIRRAYRGLMLKQRQHPDLGGSHGDAALLNEAYAVLKDVGRRAAYDRIFLENIAAEQPHSHPPTQETSPKGDAYPPSERRRSARRPYMGHLQVANAAHKSNRPGQCRDISDSGLSFRTVAKLEPGEHLSVTFADDPGLRLDAVVRWKRIVPQRFGPPLYEGGVEFSDVNIVRFREFCERVRISFN